MKNKLRLLNLLFIFLFVTSQGAEAQLINYERRNKRMKVKASREAARQKKTVTALKTNTADTSSETRAARQSDRDYPVSNRLEGIYDLNQDGTLQKEEVHDFLNNVVSAVEKRGNFAVSSDILKEFDTDHDGQINRYELVNIKKKLD